MTTEHNEQASYTAADMADQGAAQFRAGYAAAKAEQSAAAPGIDLAPIKLLALKWRYMEGGYGSMASQNRRDAFNRCANDLEKALKLIDASPEGGSEARDGERYRWLRERWGRISETYDADTPVMTEIGDDTEGWITDGDSLDRCIDAAMQTSDA